jgi:hypothetical protein
MLDVLGGMMRTSAADVVRAGSLGIAACICTLDCHTNTERFTANPCHVRSCACAGALDSVCNPYALPQCAVSSQPPTIITHMFSTGD